VGCTEALDGREKGDAQVERPDRGALEDDSLRTERTKSDEARKVNRASAQRAADGVIDHARAVADAVLTASRRTADNPSLRRQGRAESGVVGRAASPGRSGRARGTRRRRPRAAHRSPGPGGRADRAPGARARGDGRLPLDRALPIRRRRRQPRRLPGHGRPRRAQPAQRRRPEPGAAAAGRRAGPAARRRRRHPHPGAMSRG